MVLICLEYGTALQGVSTFNIKKKKKKEDIELQTVFCLFVVCFGFNVTSAQYRSYRDVPALLVEEDLRCPSVLSLRHERAPK
jgi:hypothetical protein